MQEFNSSTPLEIAQFLEDNSLHEDGVTGERCRRYAAALVRVRLFQQAGVFRTTTTTPRRRGFGARKQPRLAE